ncbi:MAG TPA: hypothetical protein VFV83_04885 [Chthoniobacteraceae bacterium]|nr:hypothetical protein [Chthoniobacteraceae bacterium]
MRSRRFLLNCSRSLSFLLVLIASAPHAMMQEPRTITMRTGGAPAAVSRLLIAPEIPSPGRETTPVAPGHYMAVPYTMRVYVPPFLDSKMAIEPGDQTAAKPLIIRPELRLVPAR